VLARVGAKEAVAIEFRDVTIETSLLTSA